MGLGAWPSLARAGWKRLDEAGDVVRDDETV
jgi:hypothetical protein